MRRSIVARAIGAAVPLTIALLMSAQPVAAGVASTSGSPGNYTVTDTHTSPEAHCFYPNASHANTDLTEIKVHAPTMFAKNSTGGVDTQTVGWQYSIQHGTSVGSMPSGWTTSYKSSIVKATAHDNHAASFSTRTWHASANVNRWWRVKLLMFWYKPGSSTKISGQVNWIVDYYKISYPPNPDGVNPTDCIPGE